MMEQQPELFRLSPRPRVKLGAALVRRLLCRAEALTGLEYGALMRTNRERTYSHARFAVMKVARENGRTTGEIGRALRMDHTSVLHGCRRAIEMEGQDEDFTELLQLLRREARK